MDGRIENRSEKEPQKYVFRSLQWQIQWQKLHKWWKDTTDKNSKTSDYMTIDRQELTKKQLKTKCTENIQEHKTVTTQRWQHLLWLLKQK